jgi:S-methylmethionine transporter
MAFEPMAMEEAERPEGRPELRKVLRIRHVVAIGLGFTVSDGILLVISQEFGVTGPATILLTAVAALAMSAIMFAGAELAGSMPAADFAGEWGKRTLGSFWGFLGTLSYGAVAIIAIGLLWFPMGTYLQPFFPGVPVPVIGTVCFLITAGIVSAGVLFSGETEVWLNVALFVVVLGMSVIAVFHFHASYFVPFFKGGLHGWFYAFPFIVYVLFGPEVMFAASEENVISRRFWPKAMLVLMLIVVGSFLFMEVALTGLLTLSHYTLKSADFAVAGKFLFGQAGQDIFNVVAFVAVFHAMIGAMYVGSRFLYKMGRRGYLPETFGRVNRRTRVPYPALGLTLVIGAAIGSTYYVDSSFYLEAAALLTMAGLFGWAIICSSHISYRLQPRLRAQYPGDWHVPPGDGPGGIWISVLGLVIVAVVTISFLIQNAFNWWFLPLWVVIAIVWWRVAQRTVASREEEVSANSGTGG